MEKKSLVIIRGAQGSGKSTFAAQLIKEQPEMNFDHFEADMFHVDENGVYNWKPERSKAGHEWCRSQVEENMVNGNNIIVSNTSSQLWEMQPYLDLAVKYNYEVSVFRCRGEYQNLHGVPEEQVAKVRARMEPFACEILV